jgi:glycerate 2-kinase
MRIVACADKFRGSATAAEVCAAIAAGARANGVECDEVPMADGGEGFLDVLGGSNRTLVVTGPLGDPVVAGWRLRRDGTAIVEMARASGLSLVGGAEGNDPISASTYGTGELIAAALEQGARRILVGVGGSATTDGGLGAQRALYPAHRLRGVELVVACDVDTRFVDAAAVFAPQKGASRAQVELLTNRLARLVQVYRDEHGVDVSEAAGAGAAGGLAGGLLALGADLVEGFEVVAEEVGLADHLDGADLVVTGEGHLDEQSFDGKVVGGVAAMARDAGVPVLAIVGDADPDAREHATQLGVDVVSLVDRYGEERAHADALACVADVVAGRCTSGEL